MPAETLDGSVSLRRFPFFSGALLCHRQRCIGILFGYASCQRFLHGPIPATETSNPSQTFKSQPALGLHLPWVRVLCRNPPLHLTFRRIRKRSRTDTAGRYSGSLPEKQNRNSHWNVAPQSAVGFAEATECSREESAARAHGTGGDLGCSS